MDDVSVRNATMGVAAVNDTSGDAPGQFMASGQGFGILADQTAGTDVTFTNALRVSGNNSTPRSVELDNRLWLRVDSETYDVQSTAGIGFVPEATIGLDAGFDSPQLATTVSLFTTLESGEQLSIQGRELFDNEIELTLGFQTLIPEIENYTIRIDQFEGVGLTENDIFLTDHLLGTITNLKETDYTFASSETAQRDRFTVTFREPLLAVNDVDLGNQISLYPNPIENIITLAYSGSRNLQELVITDIQGKVIRTMDLGNFEQQRSFNVSDLNAGIYFFRISGAETVQNFKIIKR